MTNLNFIKEFFLMRMMQMHLRDAACRIIESAIFFSFALLGASISFNPNAEANETPLAFRLCEDRFSFDPKALVRLDLWHLTNSENPRWRRTEAELHARWFIANAEAFGIRTGAFREEIEGDEKRFSLNSPALFFSHRQNVTRSIDLTIRGEFEFEASKRSLISLNAVFAPLKDPFHFLAGVALDASGSPLIQLGFRYVISPENRFALEGDLFTREAVSFSRVALTYQSFSLVVQAPLAWERPEETSEFSARLGFAFGAPPEKTIASPANAESKRRVSATVLESQPAFHLFMVDRGADSGIEIGQEFDIYDEGTSIHSARFSVPIGRARVTHLQQNRAILKIEEYRMQKTVDSGCIAIEASDEPKRVAALKQPLLR